MDEKGRTKIIKLAVTVPPKQCPPQHSGEPNNRAPFCICGHHWYCACVGRAKVYFKSSMVSSLWATFKGNGIATETFNLYNQLSTNRLAYVKQLNIQSVLPGSYCLTTCFILTTTMARRRREWITNKRCGGKRSGDEEFISTASFGEKISMRRWRALIVRLILWANSSTWR